MKKFILITLFISLVSLSAAQDTLPERISASNYILGIINESGVDIAQQTFTDIQSDTIHYSFSEREFNNLGYQLINQARFNEAIAVFKMNRDLFPQSPNVHDSLGEAYMFNGEKVKAIESYKNISIINPEIQSGENIIKNIDTEIHNREMIKLSMLFKAAKEGDSSLFKALITANPLFLNQSDHDGNSNLHYAVYGGHTEIVEYLISINIDSNKRNSMGQTPYNLAEYGNLDEIKQLLIDYNVNTEPQQFPILTSRYLGQNEPGNTPEIFAPGIVSTHSGVYGNIVFSPDFKEACWTPNDGNSALFHGGLITSKFINGQWTPPEEVRFLKEEYSHRSPFYSLDGNKLYFQGHLKSEQGFDQKEKFYFVEKTDNGWSEPTLLDTVFNKYSIHWQFSLDQRNTIYFGGRHREKENSGGIYCSYFVNEKYEEPKLIFPNELIKEYVFGPAISLSGDYMIFTRVHPRGSENPRIFSLYVSFHESDNEWSTPEEVGELLNMSGNQPRLTPDGKYLFFISGNSSPYWVSTEIIEYFR